MKEVIYNFITDAVVVIVFAVILFFYLVDRAFRWIIKLFTKDY